MPTAIPRMSTTSDVLWPTGSQWLGTASSEIADITAVAARSSGMPAAMSAPNTTTSSTSETGTEVSSALRKSWEISAVAVLSMLASPASATRRSGCFACTAATARSAGTTALSAFPTSPGIWKLTRTERLLAEISPTPP